MRLPDPSAVVPPRRPVDATALRRAVLAVSVLDDVALRPCSDGIVLGEPGETVAHVTWEELAVAVGDAAPESVPARLRLRPWLRLRADLAQLQGLAGTVWREHAVLHALPVDHATHPGPAWVVDRLLGGVLDLGVALRDVTGPDEVVPLPPDLAARVRIDVRRWWPGLLEHAERMGDLAAERLQRDGRGLLSPIGGCDVPTLLATRSLRTHLANEDGTGMRALAVPMRERGWFDLARIDPAFVGAAWTATEPQDRGVGRPLLVTADEVALGQDSGDGRQLVLLDPAPAATARR